MIVVYFERRSEKKIEEKKPPFSAMLKLPRKLHPQVVSPPALEKANPLKQSFGSTDRKAQPLTLPSPRCLEGKQTSLWPYLSLHITGKQLNFATVSSKAGKKKKKGKSQSLSFIPYIYTVSLKRGKNPPE